ncbi:cell wall hydrolase [Parageobacillus sp. VR-IP]|uniref:cell wall hydrolase n=1 Tax=Parageobacillus sp. VR-IP TaxID=2742205 RepID=UPI0015834148|nr:cell wall hydrolase [Parageobacillus sp. VR-IP]NUK31326.1 cell wall hydrolase [Parageobacillus sp. VR-IP]
MRKLIVVTALGLSMLIAPPAFAYEVKSGDTVSKIAEEHRVTLYELSRANPQIKNVNLIYVGQNIVIPGKNERATEEKYKPITHVAPHEKDLLARLVRAEAKVEPYAGKVAVVIVVLNQVNDPQFPNSIKEVIYQPGQFTPVSNGAINQPADVESIKAVEEALAYDRSKGYGSLFFYNPKTSHSRWLDSRPTTIVIGNHVFKK